MKINDLLESASVGGTSSGAIATAPGKVGKGKLQRRPKGSLFAEGSEFGSYYSEEVAQKIFDKRQDISSEDEVLNQAYHIVANEQGQRTARYKFNYDEDFPSDVVSAYFWLQKQQGVAEAGRHGYDDAGFSLAPGHDEGEPVYNPRFDRTGQYDRKAKYSQDYNYNTGKPLGAPEPAKKGFVFYNVADPQTAQQLGLKQTKSGKWYLPTGSVFAQKQADKVFGKGKIWYPKESVEENKKGVRAVKHTTKPRNPVAKNATAAIGGGAAGAHKNKKKAAKQGDVKHKKPAYESALEQELKVLEGYGRYWCSTDKKWKERKGPKQSRK